MMRWQTTSGCLNSPFLFRKQKFWWIEITTSGFPALSSGQCCGFRLHHDQNKDFPDNETKVAKYNEVIDMAIEASTTLSFGGSHTKRMCLLRSASAVLYRSPEKDWDVTRVMKGWGLGEWLVLLPYDDVSEDDLSDE